MKGSNKPIEVIKEDFVKCSINELEHDLVANGTRNENVVEESVVKESDEKESESDEKESDEKESESDEKESDVVKSSVENDVVLDVADDSTRGEGNFAHSEIEEQKESSETLIDDVPRLLTPVMTFLPQEQEYYTENQLKLYVKYERLLKEKTLYKKVKHSPGSLRKMFKEWIPPDLRGQIWLQLLNLDPETVKKYRNIYAKLLTQNIGSIHKKIQRDTGRTFPKEPKFTSIHEESLERILWAFAALDSSVGYCQGEAFLVGCCLFHVNEEEAFWIFSRMMKDQEKYDLMNLFIPKLPKLFEQMYIIENLLKLKVPALYTFFSRNMLKPELYVSKFILTLCTRDFNVDAFTRIFDLFLLDGWVTIVRVIIGLFASMDSDIRKLTLSEEIMPFIDNFCSKQTGEDIIQLMDKSGISENLYEAHLKKYYQKTLTKEQHQQKERASKLQKEMRKRQKENIPEYGPDMSTRVNETVKNIPQLLSSGLQYFFPPAKKR